MQKQEPSGRKHFPDLIYSPQITTLYIFSEWQLRGMNKEPRTGRNLLNFCWKKIFI